MKLLIILLHCTLVSLVFSKYTGSLKILKENQANDKQLPITFLSEEPNIRNIRGSIVQIIKAQPFDACTSLKPLTLKDQTVLLLIDARDNKCQIIQKVFTAKQLMVKGVILLTDETIFTASQNHLISDNPLFLVSVISKEDSTPLLTLLETKEVFAALSIHLVGPRKDEVEVLLSSLNARSYEMIRMWHMITNTIPFVKNKVVFTPRSALLGCSEQNKQYLDICRDQNHIASCACKGTFCSPESQGMNTIEMVKEDIRQRLIFEADSELYFDYMESFQEKCLPIYHRTLNIEDCAYNTMDIVGIKADEINYQIQQFLRTCSDQKQAQIKTELYSSLKSDSIYFRNSQKYPMLSLNKKEIIFNNQYELQSILCKELSIEETEGCMPVSNDMTFKKVAFWLFTLSICIIILIGIGVSIVVCFRHKLRKDMNKEVKMQVSTAAEHYLSMSKMKSQN